MPSSKPLYVSVLTNPITRQRLSVHIGRTARDLYAVAPPIHELMPASLAESQNGAVKFCMLLDDADQFSACFRWLGFRHGTRHEKYERCCEIGSVVESLIAQ